MRTQPPFLNTEPILRSTLAINTGDNLWVGKKAEETLVTETNWTIASSFCFLHSSTYLFSPSQTQKASWQKWRLLLWQMVFFGQVATRDGSKVRRQREVSEMLLTAVMHHFAYGSHHASRWMRKQSKGETHAEHSAGSAVEFERCRPTPLKLSRCAHTTRTIQADSPFSQKAAATLNEHKVYVCDKPGIASTTMHLCWMKSARVMIAWCNESKRREHGKAIW